MNTSCSGQGSTGGPEVYEDWDPVQREAEGPSRSKAEDLVHVENVVSLFSSPSTRQKVRKCGGHKLGHIVWPVGLFFIA